MSGPHVVGGQMGGHTLVSRHYDRLGGQRQRP